MTGAPGAAGGGGRPALACVTGRFQPVHHDHVRLFRAALDAADRLVVAVTNPDPAGRRPERGSAHRHRAEANPLTYYERLRLLRAALAGIGAGERSDVVPFDLTRPEVWRHYVPGDAVQFVGTYGGGWEQDKARRLAHAGYPVVAVPGDPSRRQSATDVRAAIRAGRPWEHLVPEAVAVALQDLLTARGGLDADPAAPAGPHPSPWAPPPPAPAPPPPAPPPRVGPPPVGPPPVGPPPVGPPPVGPPPAARP